MRRYFLFDTETGGLDANSVSLFSLYGIILDEKLSLLDSIDLKIKPDNGHYHLDVEAMAVNKINIVEHHKNAITEKLAGTKLREFLFRNSGFASEKLIPSGHNIGRLDIPMGERLIGFEEWNRIFSRRTLDTGTIAQFFVLRGILPETNNCSLKELCEHYRINYTNAHEAKTDVLLTLEVLKALVRDGTFSPCPTTVVM
jgi:DNA polymerase III epsilon subunit-like protein